MDFTSYQQVIDAFKAGAKFEVDRGTDRLRVVDILEFNGRMEVRTEATPRLGMGWTYFQPNGHNSNSAARLVMTAPAPKVAPTLTAPTLAAVSYYVALVENGVPKFSENPKAHASNGLAMAEAQRLANLHPGKLFKVYKEAVAGFRVEPKPKTRRYRVEIAANQDGKLDPRIFEVTASTVRRNVGDRLTNMATPALGIFGGTIVRVDEFEVPVK